jgi:hypothetical protein
MAPVSMPAGLSQTIQSNFSRNSTADAFFRQRILVAGLRGWEQGERIDALVADQRLREFGVALHDIDEVEDHTALRPHDEVQIAEADIEIDHDDILAGLRERGPE